MGRRKTWLALAGVALATGVLVPFGTVQLPTVPSFLPIFASATVLSEVVTSWLLSEQYLAQGDPRLLWAAGAYLYSSSVIVPHLLTFPGVFSPGGLLGAGPSSATWLWVAWHGGFPLCLLRGHTLPKRRLAGPEARRRTLGRLRAGILLGVVAFAALATLGKAFLPAIIRGNDYTVLTHTAGPVVVLLNAAALVATLRTRPASALERYLPVAAAISLCDAVLTLTSLHRYTLGWYAARVDSLLTGVVVLLSLLVALGRLYRELTSAAQRNDALVRGIPDLLLRVHRDGTCLDARFNRAPVFPVDEAGLLGRKLQEVSAIPREVSGRLCELVERCVATESLQVAEFRADTPQGPQEEEARVVPCGAEEAVVLLRLVTERRAVERLQRDFVSTVSHELRTPLTAIRGALGLMGGGVAGDLPQQSRELVRLALGNAERLGRLIDDLLDLEKTEAGKLQMRVERVPLRALLDRAAAALGPYAALHGVRVELSGTATPEVMADPDRLQQVVANLLSNACKFSTPGETVKLHVSQGPSGQGAEAVRVSVTNRGAPVAPEFRARAFQRFSQAQPGAGGGTGLGLAICRAIVEQLGGRIDYESGSGSTTFWFELPPADAAGRQQPGVDLAG